MSKKSSVRQSKAKKKLSELTDEKHALCVWWNYKRNIYHELSKPDETEHTSERYLRQLVEWSHVIEAIRQLKGKIIERTKMLLLEFHKQQKHLKNCSLA